MGETVGIRFKTEINLLRVFDRRYWCYCVLVDDVDATLSSGAGVG